MGKFQSCSGTGWWNIPHPRTCMCVWTHRMWSWWWRDYIGSSSWLRLRLGSSGFSGPFRHAGSVFGVLRPGMWGQHTTALVSTKAIREPPKSQMLSTHESRAKTIEGRNQERSTPCMFPVGMGRDFSRVSPVWGTQHAWETGRALSFQHLPSAAQCCSPQAVSIPLLTFPW